MSRLNLKSGCWRVAPNCARPARPNGEPRPGSHV